MAIWMAAGALLLASPAYPQGEKAMGQGRAVVTILSKQHGETPASVPQENLSIKVNGKPAQITGWRPLGGPGDRLELVFLIDSGARNSLGNQYEYITHFINNLPPNTLAAIAYMQNGRAVFPVPLSADRAQALKALHLPGGTAGESASPYFCLSDLAQNWPSRDRGARRAVVMVTDGIDNYERRFDPEDPYVMNSIADSLRAGVTVYSIYWMVQGRADLSLWGSNAGQSLLAEVSDATGGRSFWQGMGNPVSFQPYLEDLDRNLKNQYELVLSTRLDGKPTTETLRLKVNGLPVDVTAPQQVFIDRAGAAQ